MLMPVGIDQRQAADIIQPLQIFLTELDINRFEILLELGFIAAADHKRADCGTCQQPCQRNLRRRHAVCFADFNETIDNIPKPLFVADRRFVPAGCLTRTIRRTLAAPVFATQKPGCKRAPDQHAEALIHRKRQQFIFRFARFKRIMEQPA